MTDYIFYTNEGIEKTNKGDFEGALKDFDKALELNPENALTYFSQAIVYHNLQEIQKAYDTYSKSIEYNPEMIDAYYNRAHVLLLDKNAKKEILEQALSDLKKSYELDNKFLDAYYYAAVVEMKLENYTKSVELLDKVLEMEPDAIHSRALKKLILKKYLQ